VFLKESCGINTEGFKNYILFLLILSLPLKGAQKYSIFFELQKHKEKKFNMLSANI